MNRKSLILTGSLLFVGAAAAQDYPLAPGAQLEKLADGFAFTEGPAADAAGDIRFTDQPNDRILKWKNETDEQLSVFQTGTGRANGLWIDAEGCILACSDEHNELRRISPDGTYEVLVADFDGKLLNGPNDVWQAPNGDIYFTDPLYPREYWTRPKEMQQDGEHVYRLSADRRVLERVAVDLVKPNGLIGTPDGAQLYVADIGADKTYLYNIGADGRLSGKKLFTEMGSDGMTMDADGNIYLTGRGVTVFNAAGERIAHIAVPERWAANVTLGGADRRTLFITASGGLYAIRIKTKK